MLISTLRHRAEYALVRGGEALLSRLPPTGVERIGMALGGVVRNPLGIRSSVVEQNLRRAFPDADDPWIDATTRATYRHLGREAAGMLRLSTLEPAAIRERVQMSESTWAAVREALAEGRGVIFATGHYGNWEMAAAGLAAWGIAIAAIVKRQRNPLFDARIEAVRRGLGVETIEMRQARREVPRALRAGTAVGIVADQAPVRGGVTVPFFGIPTSAHRGTALFALRIGSPIIAAVARRMPDGRYDIRGDRIDVRRTASLEDDVIRVTAAFTAHLEREIRQDPSQYFWFHKRWKARRAEEHASRLTGTKAHTGRGAGSL